MQRHPIERIRRGMERDLNSFWEAIPNEASQATRCGIAAVARRRKIIVITALASVLVLVIAGAQIWRSSERTSQVPTVQPTTQTTSEWRWVPDQSRETPCGRLQIRQQYSKRACIVLPGILLWNVDGVPFAIRRGSRFATGQYSYKDGVAVTDDMAAVAALMNERSPRCSVDLGNAVYRFLGPESVPALPVRCSSGAVLLELAADEPEPRLLFATVRNGIWDVASSARNSTALCASLEAVLARSCQSLL